MLISEEYRQLQQRLHESPEYGVASLKYAEQVAREIVTVRVGEILDYGAGKGRLGQALKQLVPYPLVVHYYDPAIPEWSAAPQPCEFVACIDVLEHVEPALLDNVLDDLQRVTARLGIFSVHTAAAKKVLADGRNAHLIQQPVAWWLPKFLERFELEAFNRVPNGFWVIVEKKRG
jgi:2-polyprenyl-3-methyl-5-hydroxy-6-metoxy-1,4-benzoquinol methylase